jgi:hypothetical protein
LQEADDRERCAAALREMGRMPLETDEWPSIDHWMNKNIRLYVATYATRLPVTTGAQRRPGRPTKEKPAEKNEQRMILAASMRDAHAAAERLKNQFYKGNRSRLVSVAEADVPRLGLGAEAAAELVLKLLVPDSELYPPKPRPAPVTITQLRGAFDGQLSEIDPDSVGANF